MGVLGGWTNANDEKTADPVLKEEIREKPAQLQLRALSLMCNEKHPRAANAQNSVLKKETPRKCGDISSSLNSGF